MATSRVPAAIDALIAVLQAASGLSGVTVVDGPTVNDTSDADYVFVGWQPDAEGDEVAEIEQDFAHMGARTRDETFTIACYAESWTGDTDMKARRDRVFALVAAAEDALRASGANPSAPTLGGAVLWSHLTAGALTQRQSTEGVVAGVKFTVSCRARL